MRVLYCCHMAGDPLSRVEPEPTRPNSNGYKPERWNARPLDADKNLWFKQPNESIQAYEAFMTYLTLPSEDRTYQKVADILGKTRGLMTKWAQMWSWRIRVGAYEEHYLLLRLESVEADRDDMWRRQKGLADMGMNILESHFETLIASIDDLGKTSAVKPEVLVRMMDVVTKVQRMAVLGRIQGAEEVQERNERLAEGYAEELAHLLKEVMNEIEPTPQQQEKLKLVLERHLVGTGT